MQSLSVEEDVTMSGALPAHVAVEEDLAVDVLMQFWFSDNEEEFEGCQLSSSGHTEATGSGKDESGVEDDKEEDKEEEPCPPVKRVWIDNGCHGLVHGLKCHQYR